MLQWLKAWLRPAAEAAHLRSGRWGERQAVRYLKARRYDIRGQRVRVGKHDEIDILAQLRDIMVFVEVKTRKNEAFGRPAAAVNATKRKRLSRAAVHYLRKHKITSGFIRFDIIEVIGAPGGSPPEIRHIENAFELDRAYRLWW